MHDLGLRAQSPLNDFLSIRHDFSIRKNMGKKAVEEEEGSKKLVEMEMMMSNQGVDYVIEKKKTNYVIVGRYDRYWYSASIAYSAPIDVTAAFPTVTQGVVAGLRSN
ncbi:hypothetical protein L249_7079 [Ophiocordyceps polyrhachis-furcata BCC 54312]|uniref:Uncharacterized protein n=1 Tax=Ophiocordyceps polyrhachis-furcata BCC 54312 TaxID=1330021 RepID=A0A367LK11_9HYPO|nr:hypothetical protein L249_7079 [Ophiocordyceps polyrhachis-furcata BCC 54312]